MAASRKPGDSLVGEVVGGAYQIVRLLGEGGMASVHEAVQLRLNKRMAVKVMSRALADNTEAIARFRREAEITSAIGHPHIVQVFDSGVTPAGEPFLAMELLEGEDLEHRMARLGRLPVAAVLPIMRQVASALAAAHAKGIVHRDLKPANIYLIDAAGEGDFVKVLDFGVSKVRSTSKLTNSSRVIGTPKYMSPEQAQGLADEVDERTDQWSLACTVWEALAGEGPFVAADDFSTLYKIVHEDPAPLSPKVRGVLPRAEQVLRRALSKDKDHRYLSIMDFALAFEDAVQSLSTMSPAFPRRIGHAPARSGSQRQSSLRLVFPAGRKTLAGYPRYLLAAGQRAGRAFAKPASTKPTAKPRTKQRWVWLGTLGAAAVIATGALAFHGRTSKPEPPPSLPSLVASPIPWTPPQPELPVGSALAPLTGQASEPPTPQLFPPADSDLAALGAGPPVGPPAHSIRPAIVSIGHIRQTIMPHVTTVRPPKAADLAPRSRGETEPETASPARSAARVDGLLIRNL